MNTENEIYSLATCPGTKYSGDTITLRSTPRDGIGPYYVAFKKDGIIIDPSRLGGESNPITNAPENVEIIRTYTLDDIDVSNALTGTIGFSVFIRGSCPTGGGLQFDGVNDYVDAGNAASLNGLNSRTISFWMTTNAPLTTYYVPFSKGGGYAPPGTNGYDFRIEQTTGVLRFDIADYLDNDYSIFTVSSVVDNNWNHIVAVFDYNNSIKLYRNGVLQESMNMVGIIVNDNSYNLLLGKGSVVFPFNGSIDEVRVYNRALSPTEILDLYDGSTPRNGLVLEHIYSLGNANDLSGYGNNGISINGPVFIPNACMDTCTVAIGCIAPVCNFVVT